MMERTDSVLRQLLSPFCAIIMIEKHYVVVINAEQWRSVPKLVLIDSGVFKDAANQTHWPRLFGPACRFTAFGYKKLLPVSEAGSKRDSWQ